MQLIITFNSWWLDRVISNKVTSCFVKNKDGTIKKRRIYQFFKNLSIIYQFLNVMYWKEKILNSNIDFEKIIYLWEVENCWFRLLIVFAYGNISIF